MAAEAKKKEKTINNDRVNNNLEQYILTQNLKELTGMYDSQVKNKEEFKYCTFRQVNGPGSQLINRLRGINDLSVFYRIKTSTLSLLQPKIRLYKVQYEDFKRKPSGQVDQSSITALPVPCYKEFKFSDNFGVETAASVQDYLNYESTKPSFRNVGLTSFTMLQNGETHGAIENNIECKLELKFKSLKDLNASPPGEPRLKYVDLILWPPSKITKGAETYNAKHYEIKALLGYTAPDEKQLRALNLPVEEINAIRDIEKMNQITETGKYNVSPSWSPDGKFIAYASKREGVSSIYRIDPKSKEENRVTPKGMNAESPTWSPDGSMIAFSGKKGGDWKIYYSLSSGGEAVRLTNSKSGLQETMPSWGLALR